MKIILDFYCRTCGEKIGISDIDGEDYKYNVELCKNCLKEIKKIGNDKFKSENCLT
jgi:hypothetical protein